MERRTFLLPTILSIAVLLVVTLLPRSGAIAAIDRTSKWKPNPNPLLAVEWRYVAGRIADESGDYGFVVAVTDMKLPQQSQGLLIERQNLSGDNAFSTTSYTGTLSYDTTSARYTFHAALNQASATWQWDDGAQLYRLTLTSPDLTLANVVFRPRGDLIPEGGDGMIDGGQVSGVQIGSDYYADWTSVEIGSTPRGFARVDMQGLYPVLGASESAATSTVGAYGRPAQTVADYDHHWFAIAGQLAGEPVWISVWRIEAQHGPLWDVTIAHGSGANWSVGSTTEQSGAVAPLSVRPLVYQSLPASAGLALSTASTGSAWHLSAGTRAPADMIDLEIVVPPGQFADGARLGLAAGLSWVEEAVGAMASGTVGGQTLTNVTLVVAETTAEFYPLRLPLVRR
jgi:hypothetical protein